MVSLVRCPNLNIDFWGSTHALICMWCVTLEIILIEMKRIRFESSSSLLRNAPENRMSTALKICKSKNLFFEWFCSSSSSTHWFLSFFSCSALKARSHTYSYTISCVLFGWLFGWLREFGIWKTCFIVLPLNRSQEVLDVIRAKLHLGVFLCYSFICSLPLASAIGLSNTRLVYFWKWQSITVVVISMKKKN